MKRTKLRRLLAMALVFCISLTLVTPASAAWRSSRTDDTGLFDGFDWNNLWNRLFRQDTGDTETPEEPAEEVGSPLVLTLVEDQSTVTEGTQLRASTYTASQADTSATKNASATADTKTADATAETVAYNSSGDYSAYEDTGYYYDEACTRLVTDITRTRSGRGTYWNPYTYEWTITYDGGKATATTSTITLYKKPAVLKYFPVTLYNYQSNDKSINDATHQLEIDNAGDETITTWEGIYFGGNSWGANVKETDTYSGTTVGYANWNKWTGDFAVDGQETHGNKTYSGLVESSLNANGNIQFTKTEAGIFTNDTRYKDVYTNVELPFVYENGVYTFDANEFGAYFHEDEDQGSAGTPASNTRLYYNTTPQSHNFSAQDKRTKGWFPFNDTTSVTTNSSGGNADYFFGMNATIPFTMTANGCMDPTDDKSEPITFSFSGDDDVWVFIDGVLVLDVGGVRNGMNATIDFANNTWKISAMTETINGTKREAEDVNGASVSGTIFNDGDTTGTLNQTRETFAATDSHELTIFYLERGAGSSNCKIQFNLPMKDTVSVTKRATQSINADGTVSPLTEAEQATVNNIDFGFTLYKKVGDEAAAPVANTNYNLLNENGQVISTPSTDAKGHFTLRNGQTAKFVGEIAEAGAEYYVVEDIPNNTITNEDGTVTYTFSQATYTYAGTAANGFAVGNKDYQKGSDIPQKTIDITKANTIQSDVVTAKGSTEAEDSLQFICENYFDASLPNPSSHPVDDQIVIDYGLSVVIDALANDVYRGDKIELTDVSGAQYGTATIENGKITYQLTKQLTGVEVLTYTAQVTGKDENETETTQANTAKIYIIPATSMYYEENFGTEDAPLVIYSSGWSDVGTEQTDPQEPGVVGTVGDSPYGSDAAYLKDSGDSNGTSKYVDTTNGAASFSYEFTGTGTTFFARTSPESGYMRVVITQNDNTVYTAYRDTSYKAVDGKTNVTMPLYNIPVFTWETENYGTYTVTVTIANEKGATTVGAGTKFWLDGIRVISPLNGADDNASVAEAAYATDGEANMTVATLRQKLIGEAGIEPVQAVDESGNPLVDENGDPVYIQEVDENGDPAVDDDGNPVYKTQLSWDGTNFVVFTDTNGEITSAEEYKSNGPKEEVYLYENQSITFSLTNWDPNTNKIYLGIKAPVGSGTVSINDNPLNINNATDCYYDISDYKVITTIEGVNIATFTVTATSSLISVTNIKVTGNAEFTIVNPDDGGEVNGDKYE